MRKSNYDKYPSTEVDGSLYQGWNEIRNVLSRILGIEKVLVVDCYTGVYDDEFLGELSVLVDGNVIQASSLYKDECEVKEMTKRLMTDDVLFGYVTNLHLIDIFPL